MTVQIKAKIISNRNISANYWHCELSAASIAKFAKPGQFINIKVSNAQLPLLRRPLSIHGVNGKHISIFYEALGLGTRVLSSRKPGEDLDIIGPLGNGFEYNGNSQGYNKYSLLVCGGMGVAPLVFLAKKFNAPKPLILIGARSEKQITCVAEFKQAGCDIKIATDDGSVGFKGKVTDLLKVIISKGNFKEVFACGPEPMLKSVAKICTTNRINAQLSLEAHMACGIGACLGCAVETKSGFKRVCKDGPVFTAKELIL